MIILQLLDRETLVRTDDLLSQWAFCMQDRDKDQDTDTDTDTDTGTVTDDDKYTFNFS